MDKLPENLKSAYEDLAAQLLKDEQQVFATHWNTLPASACKLMPVMAKFHGFFIAQNWLKLSMAGQQLTELADTDNGIAGKSIREFLPI